MKRPLMTVARTGSVDAAKVLLAHGAKVDARESWHGETALMWAAAQKHPAMISALIAAGAEVNAISTVVKWERQTTAEPREKWLPLGGFSPLMFAAREGCVECEKILANAGANLNLADPDGITPMVNAIINGHYDAAGFLLDKGADPNLADKTGRAALYAAVDMHTMPASNRPSPDESGNDMSSLDLIKSLARSRRCRQRATEDSAAVPDQGGPGQRHDADYRHHTDPARGQGRRYGRHRASAREGRRSEAAHA